MGYDGDPEDCERPWGPDDPFVWAMMRLLPMIAPAEATP